MSKASVVAVVAAFHERLFGDPSLDPTSADKRRQGSLKAKDLYPDESGQEDVEAESDDQDDGEEWRSSRRRKRRRRHSQAEIESDSEHDLDASPRSRSPPRPFPVVRLARAAFQQSGLSPHAASPDGAIPSSVGNGQADGRDRRTMPSEPDRTSSAHLHAAARRSQVQRSEASQMVLSPAPWWQLAYSLLFSPFSHSSPLEVKIMTILNLKCAVLCVEGSMTARRLMDRLPEILSHPAASDRTEPELLTMDQVTPHMSQDHAMLDVWSRLLVSELMQRASETTLSTCTFPTPDIAFLRTVYWLQDAACPHKLPLLMCQSSKLGARRKSKTISQEQAAQEAEKLEAAILEATVTPCQKWTLTQRAAKFWQQEAWRRAAIIHLNTAGLGRGPLYCKVRTALCDILRCNANVPPISVRSIERWYSHAIWIMAGIASVTQQDRTVCLTNLRAVSIEKAHRESALRLQRYWSISDTLGNAPDWFDDQWGGGEAASLILY
ncbi:hypothetical protein IE81DRAFT_162907 [Ceraceosorus guamensis]|uniref:Uncharacterized protein n=1 Tax=Ceraceosorus guamensis TaxID=1522189 RepID=A0A316W7N0_9BASI|nr:hypothetical protein IE81DRAFT_162907 [Ceraceosorus guamensis]PWN45594.1 hypothetical protein IE81DRAFT_162907 [Ceraceosorus guamensis]